MHAPAEPSTPARASLAAQAAASDGASLAVTPSPEGVAAINWRSRRVLALTPDTSGATLSSLASSPLQGPGVAPATAESPPDALAAQRRTLMASRTSGAAAAAVSADGDDSDDGVLEVITGLRYMQLRGQRTATRQVEQLLGSGGLASGPGPSGASASASTLAATPAAGTSGAAATVNGVTAPEQAMAAGVHAVAPPLDQATVAAEEPAEASESQSSQPDPADTVPTTLGSSPMPTIPQGGQGMFHASAAHSPASPAPFATGRYSGSTVNGAGGTSERGATVAVDGTAAASAGAVLATPTHTVAGRSALDTPANAPADGHPRTPLFGEPAWATTPATESPPLVSRGTDGTFATVVKQKRRRKEEDGDSDESDSEEFGIEEHGGDADAAAGKGGAHLDLGAGTSTSTPNKGSVAFGGDPRTGAAAAMIAMSREAKRTRTDGAASGSANSSLAAIPPAMSLCGSAQILQPVGAPLVWTGASSATSTSALSPMPVPTTSGEVALTPTSVAPPWGAGPSLAMLQVYGTAISRTAATALTVPHWHIAGAGSGSGVAADSPNAPHAAPPGLSHP